VIQSSPALVLDSGVYDVTVDSYCPNTVERAMPPLHVKLASRKAYFILVSGQPLRAKLVSSVFIAAAEAGHCNKGYWTLRPQDTSAPDRGKKFLKGKGAYSC